ncbi:MAG: hypothetical protein HGB10_02355 [Coriobacteriia bacterium]|nr:hypothetical protein [Coriobacteriia bacterium]
MTTTQSQSLRHVRVIRWIMRGIGALVALLMAALFLEDGAPLFLFATDPLHMTVLAITLAGLIIGWFADLPAAIVLIGGTAADWVINSVRFGAPMSDLGPVVSLLPIFGFVYLYCWWRSRPAKAEQTPE